MNCPQLEKPSVVVVYNFTVLYIELDFAQLRFEKNCSSYPFSHYLPLDDNVLLPGIILIDNLVISSKTSSYYFVLLNMMQISKLLAFKTQPKYTYWLLVKVISLLMENHTILCWPKLIFKISSHFEYYILHWQRNCTTQYYIQHESQYHQVNENIKTKEISIDSIAEIHSDQKVSMKARFQKFVILHNSCTDYDYCCQNTNISSTKYHNIVRYPICVINTSFKKPVVIVKSIGELM